MLSCSRLTLSNLKFGVLVTMRHTFFRRRSLCNIFSLRRSLGSYHLWRDVLMSQQQKFVQEVDCHKLVCTVSVTWNLEFVGGKILVVSWFVEIVPSCTRSLFPVLKRIRKLSDGIDDSCNWPCWCCCNSWWWTLM